MPVRYTCFILAPLVLLTLFGCGSSTEPEEPESDLLTDEEMLTEEAPNAPEENPVRTDWIIANNIPIRSLNSDNFSDLEALVPYLEGKRIVQLGENTHGA